MSDYSCLKEHLLKALGQTIHQTMVVIFWVSGFFLCNSGRMSFGAKTEGQEEERAALSYSGFSLGTLKSAQAKVG